MSAQTYRDAKLGRHLQRPWAWCSTLCLLHNISPDPGAGLSGDVAYWRYRHRCCSWEDRRRGWLGLLD